VDVEVLIPRGASPHVFEPTPEAFRKFAQTQLFVMVGAGLEFWAQKLITATTGDDLMIVKAIDGVHLLWVDEHHHAGQKHQAEDGEISHEGDEYQGANPHVWLDPLVGKSLAQAVTLALIELSPEHAQDLRQHLDRYLEKLNVLDETIQETVKQFQNKEFVAFHPAWSYFARRYGLVEVAVIQASPGREPTPKDLQKIIQTIEDYGIKAVFAEPQLNPSAASTIASEAGVKVLLLDPLGGSDLPGRDSYINLLDYNLEIMREAML
jgi:zinc transport system substrate-binding protein